MRKKVEIFTDGACRGNPGPGGWGVLLRFNGRTKQLHGGEKLTTNNRMELIAGIKALQALRESCEIAFTTDSQYLRRGVTEWLPRWQQNGWINSSKQPVKNKDLWQELSQEVARHIISWHWVKGHSGHKDNEAADQLANKGLEESI